MKRLSTWAILAAALAGSASSADDAPAAPAASGDAAPALDEKEQAFADLLTNAALVGKFTVDRRDGGRAGDGHEERYEIKGVTKVKDAQWLVNSRIKYGNLDVVVPVPVEVHWADDTPMICVTDLAIPLVGSEFTARVMFFDGRYAGTWRHGKVGGLMFGRIERPEAEQGNNAPTEGPDAAK